MKDYFEYIDDYVEQKLNSKQHKSFEEEMKKNSSLNEAVKNYDDAKKLSEGLLEMDMLDTLSKLQDEDQPITKKTRNNLKGIWLGMAAVLLLLLISGWWMSNREHTELDKSVILANYIRPIDNDATKSLDTIGMNDFEKGKYYFSLNRFEKAKKSIKLYITAESNKKHLDEEYYWLGAIHLELWELEEAKKAWLMSNRSESIENLKLINQ